jgi:hypothetical protein
MSWMNQNIGPNHKIYVPINKEKFIGTHVVCRSSWEHKFAILCDKNPNITQWSSESIAISYLDTTKNPPKMRRYYPDFMIKVGDQILIIEIKPYRETKPPTIGKRKKRTTLLQEQLTYTRNMSKWQAAVSFCNKMGYKFHIITERSLNI